MFCTSCGAEVNAGTKFCTYCGNHVGTPTAGQSQGVYVPQGQPIVINVNNVNSSTNVNSVAGGRAVSAKSHIVALLLCVFLGPLGAHCFYAGRIGRGILYLFTGGLFFLGWAWDAVQLIRGRFTDKYGLPIVR